MKNKQNLITLKIEYSCENDFNFLFEGYSKILRFTYNRIINNPKLSTKEITELQKSMKNKPEINSHLCNSAIYDARAMAEVSSKPIIFGGKSNFIKRCQHKITHDEFIKNKLSPIYSVGEAVQKGNRLFSILDETTVMFKPDRKHHYRIDLKNVGKK